MKRRNFRTCDGARSSRKPCSSAAARPNVGVTWRPAHGVSVDPSNRRCRSRRALSSARKCAIFIRMEVNLR
jgi:hypothetical protein